MLLNAVFKPPPAEGSGKLGTPWERMHRAYVKPSDAADDPDEPDEDAGWAVVVDPPAAAPRLLGDPPPHAVSPKTMAIALPSKTLHPCPAPLVLPPARPITTPLPGASRFHLPSCPISFAGWVLVGTVQNGHGLGPFGEPGFAFMNTVVPTTQ